TAAALGSLPHSSLAPCFPLAPAARLAPTRSFLRPTCRSLPQCLAVAAPSEFAASVRGTLRPVASAQSVPVDVAWFRSDRIPAHLAPAARPPMPATRLRRYATLPLRSPTPATPFPAPSPRAHRYRRTPATSRGSNCSPSAFLHLRTIPAHPARLVPACVAASAAPRGPQ